MELIIKLDKNDLKRGVNKEDLNLLSFTNYVSRNIAQMGDIILYKDNWDDKDEKYVILKCRYKDEDLEYHLHR